jgi:hypothetical protein
MKEKTQNERHQKQGDGTEGILGGASAARRRAGGRTSPSGEQSELGRFAWVRGPRVEFDPDREALHQQRLTKKKKRKKKKQKKGEMKRKRQQRMTRKRKKKRGEMERKRAKRRQQQQ